MNPGNRKSTVSHERWLVSYADFITLLFCFFVVLFAFARADQKKQAQVAESVDAAFHSLGIFPDASLQPAKDASAPAGADQPVLPMNIVMGEYLLSPARVKEDLNHVRRELEQTLSNQIATHTVSIKMGRDGLVISLREAGFFASGSATPKPEALPTLRQIAASLGRTPYDVRIEGHTDNVPIHTAEFDSNWELSAARATRIARLFLELKAISPERLSAAGYAEFHPVAGNGTAEGRAENRRVDLVVLPRTRINLSTPESAPSTGPWRKITDGDAAAQETQPPSAPNP
jgi:chemotaxis protein MotB